MSSVMSSGKLRRGLRNIHIFIFLSKIILFRFEKYARMRRVMLARQWFRVADECFAAMLANRQVLVLVDFGRIFKMLANRQRGERIKLASRHTAIVLNEVVEMVKENFVYGYLPISVFLNFSFSVRWWRWSRRRAW